MALNFYEFEGRIKIEFKCGCSMKFNYYLEVDLRHKDSGIDFNGRVLSFYRCQNHKNIQIDNNEIIKCLPFICDDAKIHKCVPNTFTLFYEYDYVEVPFDLNRYFYLV